MSFIIINNGNLISQYQRIQYDSANEWKTNVCKAEQPQHHMPTEKVELIKTITLGHFPYHGCCAFRLNCWVGDVAFGDDY